MGGELDSVKRSILANFIGRGWNNLLSLALVPLYIKFLGLEAYGLVGVFLLLQMLANILDLGLSATMNREMARYSVQPEKAQEARDLARTLEVSYWSIGLVTGLLVLLIAPFIAHHWVRAEHLAPDYIQKAVMIMGLTIALQWPVSFYTGGLMGLQKQLLVNAINASLATVRGGGAILGLWLIAPSINVFFAWQLIVSLLQTSLLAFFLWRNVPQTGQYARFNRQLLKMVRGFAVSLGATSIIVLLLGQLDRIILSKVLTLEGFSYYSIALTVASAVSLPMSSISEAHFPKLSQLVAQQNLGELRSLFHRYCQLAALMLFPLTGVVTLFPAEILLLWTGNASLAAEVSSVVSLLAFGVALHYGVMGTLDVLQMTYGWMKPSLYSRLVALLIITPLMLLLALKYGATGAALAWVVVYLGYLVLTPHLVYSRLLSSEKWNWYLNELCVPLCISYLVAALWRVYIPVPVYKPAALIYLLSVFMTTLLFTAASMTYTRQFIRAIIGKLRLHLLPSFN